MLFLPVIDYAKIRVRDEDEVTKMWEAATKLGFWYLKNHICQDEADAMFALGAAAMALPLAEKMRFEQGDSGDSAGYKAIGGNAVDASGQPDMAEFFNIKTDHILNCPEDLTRKYPGTIVECATSTIQPFMSRCIEVHGTMLEVLNERLGLPEGSLAARHVRSDLSASEARITHVHASAEPSRVAVGGHTDFGSLTILFNRQGGLQVLPPGEDEWVYVKPLAGHAICNIGDALALFSGGILRSNIHRVLPPPGPEAHLERWSIVYFTRPANHVVLGPLGEDSDVIKEALKEESGASKEGQETAEQWFSRRIKNQRLGNRKGPETWETSRGTEERKR